MKSLISDPLILPLILLMCLVYFLIIFQIATVNQKVASFIEYFTTFLYFFVAPEVTIEPFKVLQPSHLSTIELSPLSASIKLGLYTSIIIILKSRFKPILLNSVYLFKNLFLGLFLTLATLSFLWSETAEITLRISFLMLGISIYATHLATRYTWKDLLAIVRWSTTAIAFASAFYALTQPGIGVMPKGWKGILIHPNPLGVLMALNVTLWLFQAFYYPNQRLLALCMVGFSLYVRSNTNSATSLVLILILLSLLGSLRVLKTLPYRPAFVGVLLFMVVGTCISFIMFENWFGILEALDKDPTLTGRTDFWPILVEKVKENPLGYGVEGFWQDWRPAEDNPGSQITTKNGHRIHHAHNGFLDIGLQLGWIGLIVFILAFFTTISQSVKYMVSTKSPESLLPLVILTWILIPNITISELFKPTHVWFYYVLLTMSVNQELQRLATLQAQK